MQFTRKISKTLLTLMAVSATLLPLQLKGAGMFSGGFDSGFEAPKRQLGEKKDRTYSDPA